MHKTKAMQTFKLTARELEALPCVERPNPHGDAGFACVGFGGGDVVVVGGGEFARERERARECTDSPHPKPLPSSSRLAYTNANGDSTMKMYPVWQLMDACMRKYGSAAGMEAKKASGWFGSYCVLVWMGGWGVAVYISWSWP